ncbi:hypothetical protein C8R47DRAFT_1077400 [Mycena vitilis]|nr:hypothetical protein C8R47DRAFT_1077400 [Mycena vitilis]
MLVNNTARALMGLVPIPVALVAFQANSRNAALLEEYLRICGEKLLKVQKGVETGRARGQRSDRKHGKSCRERRGKQLVLLISSPDVIGPSLPTAGPGQNPNRDAQMLRKSIF